MIVRVSQFGITGKFKTLLSMYCQYCINDSIRNSYKSALISMKKLKENSNVLFHVSKKNARQYFQKLKVKGFHSIYHALL